MRGKRLQEERHEKGVGITPAHAGKTLFCQAVFEKNKDHPRACGENAVGARPDVAQPGSPPRMRGKHKYIAKAYDRIGITPAHAGKT